MTEPVDGLGELGILWRADRGPDTEGLRRRLRRAALRGRTALALELLIAAGGIAAGVGLIARGNRAVGAAAIGFSVLAGAIAWWARAGAPTVHTGHVAEALGAAIAQAQASYRAAWGGLWVCVAAQAFLAVLAFGAAARATAERSDETLIALGVAALFIAGFVSFSAVALERARGRLERLKRLQEALAESAFFPGDRAVS